MRDGNSGQNRVLLCVCFARLIVGEQLHESFGIREAFSTSRFISSLLCSGKV